MICELSTHGGLRSCTIDNRVDNGESTIFAEKLELDLAAGMHHLQVENMRIIQMMTYDFVCLM